MMEIIRDKNIKQLAAQALTSSFKDAGRKPVLFLSSGGSVLGILDEANKKIFDRNVICGVLEERFSRETDVNNFLQLKEKISGIAIRHWIDSVPRNTDTFGTLASRMEYEWRKWREANSGGKIIVTVGMGTDGHVAGIMPYSKADFDGPEWVRGYDAGSSIKYPLRITATFEFFRNEVDNAIIYVAGVEKRSALERVLAEDGDLPETPARIFREMKNVKIFTDIE